MSPTRPAHSAASRRQTIVATTIGNGLEFFDFTVYGFLALVIGKLFFPTFSGYGQLLLTVATFGVGFIMRPLGGIVIGAYADRAGRKKAMTLTIFLMALGCAVIAFTPTYASIGVAAPVLIVLARLIQGFSAGGEVGASTTLLVEHATPQNRGYMASWQFASQGLGVMLGAVVVGALTFTLSPENMQSWGWRVPFVIGMLIAPVGMYIRRHLEESLQIAPESATAPRRESSLRIVCSQHGKTVLAAILALVGGTTAAYVVTFYMPTYAVRELGLTPSVALFGAALTGLISFAFAPFVGLLSDRVGRKPLILWSRVFLVVLIYPGFLWLNASPTPAVLFIVLGVLSLGLVGQTVPGITMLPEMFPKPVRASGMSLVYSVGVALFGGFAPFISTWLLNATGSKLAPAWYLVVMTLVSLLGLLWLRDHTGRDIDAAGAHA
ncbi:MFS transporter [Variovorax paradoxus]|jgi:MFS family permease|uniref:MFS transporter n=2 Tax=Variovorax TaxID=34072 RepID=UPI0006E6ADB9|nr:MFS transporter [Variovorax paradoxus]KPV02976.1 MFS transporter [Variovorax paradoxus]KPV04185.1 MFS transporter [Variovorax paradoxus]KPV17287.1 MFS transporter [Variovorax paradoxus]KPV26207.1 MFS transporter [Variovorax paradoxus]